MSKSNRVENAKEIFAEENLISRKHSEKPIEQARASNISSSVNTLKINDLSESVNILEKNIESLEALESLESQEAKIIPEPKPLKELIIDSVVSSKNFFLNNLTKKVSDDESILSYKLQLKVNQEFKGIMQNSEIRPSKYGEKMISVSSALALPENLEKSQQDFKTPNLLRNKLTRDPNQINPPLEKIHDKSIIKEANELIVKEELKNLNNIPEKYKIDVSDGKNENLVLSLYKNQTHIGFRKSKLVNPEWHAPWKLYRVISGHTGWVRCIDVDPTNNWFVTGSNDRLIKFWDLASGKLKLSLTGHINTVRGVVVSPRHPYLFSCSEDKTVKCWDLEQNKVVRHYHGHLSGVYTIALHPSLDIIVTGGRDCVARVWDLRSRNQIFCLEGHNNTIASVVTQEFNPQIITGSHDSTIKLWDMRNGKCLNTLTHHKKSIRSLAVHDQEYTFISGGCDNIKVWQCPEGRFLRNLSGHNSIINSVALNKDGVVVSGADNGSMYLWDYKSGYNFQQIDSKVQSGSLSAEAGIFTIKFDHSSTRMITGECDKTIKMWKEDEDATPETHPINF